MLTGGSANVRNVLRGVACPHTRAMIDDRCWDGMKGIKYTFHGSTTCCGKIETCVRRQAVRLATWLLFITDARARRADKIATSITRRCGVAEFTHAGQQASHADRTLRAQCAAVASLRS